MTSANDSGRVRVQKGAVVSEDGVYRYILGRRWGDGPKVTWVMLNPSTADAEVDDPTIRRCMGFARSWGYSGITVVNLFALRATDPKELRSNPAPIGGENHRYVAAAMEANVLTVAAWGASSPWPTVATISDVSIHGLRNPGSVMCLGTTKSGCPRHPLYVRGDQALVPWPHRLAAAREVTNREHT